MKHWSCNSTLLSNLFSEIVKQNRVVVTLCLYLRTCFLWSRKSPNAVVKTDASVTIEEV
jgi:hypothetical protein